MENATILAIFRIICFFNSTSYFSSNRDPGAVKIVSHILKSLFYLKLVKIVSSEKDKVILGIHFIMSGDN